MYIFWTTNLINKSHIKRSLVLLVDDNSPISFLLGLVFIPPTPQFVGSIPRSLHPLLDHVIRHCLQIVRPPNFSHSVNKGCGKVRAVFSQFRSFVVPWERMVVVMPTLAHSQDSYTQIFSWVYKSVTRNIVNCGLKDLLRLSYLSYGFPPHRWAAELTNQVAFNVNVYLNKLMHQAFVKVSPQRYIGKTTGSTKQTKGITIR